ncbi:YbhB/YbcL family Raf kinase inhibitor-like protein [Sediminibacterium soli]|uniref:YbhB/YbcL family Raf kinase inhibitor-like protein n=1 Tax=Sediminibacterium soli TaxID=2698829 RepID=UPI00137B464F|nr:YbhB/YbcL family Raf kinase inhibitor-like protein [Sediminibacterium soli]NCI45607.1 YbhB/YbcL family Raf kinase inhibitor-like protein [Sediminibacterium soli]
MKTVETGLLHVESPAFENNGPMPEKYTCDGNNTNPAIRIHNLPEETACIAIIMEDPDAPGGIFDHWIEWNIPPAGIAENTNPGISGRNSSGKTGYHGPCPPSGTHRYYFHVYALDAPLDIPGHSDRKTVEQAMESHILAEGTCMGTYRHKGSE